MGNRRISAAVGPTAPVAELAAITIWNRLAGRPRAVDFSRALKAEVRDALWMLTKQWQMGEFEGDDAGSPVLAKIQATTTRLNKYQANGHPAGPFDDRVPLEAQVERQAIPFSIGKQEVSLDLRLLLGRQWMKMLAPVVPAGLLAQVAEQYRARYSIALPQLENPSDAQVCAHPEVWARVAAAAGRAVDGAKLYFHLANGGSAAAGITALAGLESAVNALGSRFVAWFDALFCQPKAGEEAWDPSRLEYQFACSAPEGGGETVFVAREYFQGHLDWYNLDLDRTRSALPAVSPGTTANSEGTVTRSLIPAPITFEGMPNTRWWAFEDQKTNFGDVKPDTRGLGKLLLIEFGLLYANDWFLIPMTLPAGSITRIAGLAVTNVFGERTWVEAAGRGADDAWQRWSMFTVSIEGDQEAQADTSLLLLPTVLAVQEGDPLEEVNFVRDETANLVWAIETVIPLADGTSKPGREAAIELSRLLQKQAEEAAAPAAPAALLPNSAAIRYQLMNSVPEHWIPFIAVHVPDGLRRTQLQRAAMPRFLPGKEKPERVRPRTMLLREGLDGTTRSPYYLHEEEVLRAGVRVSRSFQRARWYDGSALVWLGTRKQTGRGEGSSGLAFDQILPVAQK